jgi:hypothetical protein
MKKFNIEEALAGKPVVTRDGRKVGQLAHFKGTSTDYPVYAVLDSELEVFTEDGRWTTQDPASRHDLFMESAKREGWVNIYDSPNSDFPHYTGNPGNGGTAGKHSGETVWTTAEAAIKHAWKGRIATVHIEWEE